jgi:hypothetical protein
MFELQESVCSMWCLRIAPPVIQYSLVNRHQDVGGNCMNSCGLQIEAARSSRTLLSACRAAADSVTIEKTVILYEYFVTCELLLNKFYNLHILILYCSVLLDITC